MRPLLKICFIIFLLYSSGLSAQKWLWIAKDADDTTGSKQSGGDPLCATTDKAGNFIQAGGYWGKVSFGKYSLFSPGFNEENMFITKYDNNGNALWAFSTTKPSNASFIVPFSAVTDNAGNIFVTGEFKDTVTIGSIIITANNTNNAYADFFIAKFDANGNVLWAHNAKLNSRKCESVGNGIVTDALGNVYVTGRYSDTVSFDIYTLATDTTEIFLAKYDAAGNVIWVKSSKGNVLSRDYGYPPAITADIVGNVYITGTYSDTVIFSSVILSSKGYEDEFIVKYDSSGNVIWGATANEDNYSQLFGEAITCDKAGNIYESGIMGDTATFGSITVNAPKLTDHTYVVKYNSIGKALWAKVSTGGTNNEVYSISSGFNCNFYVCGTFQAIIDFNGDSLGSTAIEPSFIFKFDSSGNALCGTSIDNYNDDNNAIVADPFADDAFFTGDAYGNTCTFGDTTISDPGLEWAFQGKWSCTTCAVAPFINKPDTICAGSSIGLSASGGSIYSWSPPSGLSSTTVPDPVATPAVTTVYTVTITQPGCTSAKDSVNVVVHPGPVTTVCCDSVVKVGESVQLSATGGINYYWSPSDGLSCTNCPDPVADPMQSEIYYVTIQTDSGCIVTKAVTIEVNCGNIFIPDAFSPNGDGANDVLYVRGDCIRTMEFRIFDRWGNEVFESASPTYGWDGRYKGQPMNTGTYSYFLNVMGYDGKTYSKKGNVALVR